MRSIWMSVWIIVLGLNSLCAQETIAPEVKKLPFIRLNYQSGGVLPTNNFLKGDNATGQPINAYQAGALEYGLQTNGEKEWHHIWGMPSVGVGLYTVDFFNDEELGHPAALYGFFNNTLMKWKKFELHFEGAAGMTFNWKPYDPEINPFNVAIGSYNTVYLDFGFRGQWKLGKKWQLDLAYTFTHFSNGATTLPNMGINMTGPKVGLAYHIHGNDPVFYPLERKEFEPKNEFFGDVKLSTKQVKFDTSITQLSTEYLGINYNVFGLSLGYLRHFHSKWKYGGGIDVAYDESTTAQLDVVNGIYDPQETESQWHWNMSVFATGQMVVGKTSFFADLGYYLFRKEIPGQTPDLYQRFGVRWNVYKGVQLGAALRAYNFGIADYIEWSIGYKF
ncbi:acyloxyacyl hydrolase [bacterium SCSIO 12643]|nr:acyloxyacyl hydrolase [bacterium SCSIO 12643]